MEVKFSNIQKRIRRLSSKTPYAAYFSLIRSLLTLKTWTEISTFIRFLRIANIFFKTILTIYILSSQLMFTITYSGIFSVFSISSNRRVKKIHSQSLKNVLPTGAYCATVDSENKYFLIGSFASNVFSNKQSTNGVFIWRILSQEPWIKLIETSDLSANKKANNKKLNYKKIEYVCKLEVSPDDTKLAVVYVSGKIAVFSLPSLQLLNEWFMSEQVCFELYISFSPY
jgi:hypothetical protein